MTSHDYLRTMKSVGTAELKAHLSKHLRAVRAGETITVLDRHQPVARLVPIPDQRSELVVRPANGRIQDLELPAPTRQGGDAVQDLLRDREARV
jgi:prevent-host-death family protein